MKIVNRVIEFGANVSLYLMLYRLCKGGELLDKILSR